MREKRYVEIEEEKLSVDKIVLEGKEGIVKINSSLHHFKHKDIFPWNLVVSLTVNSTTEENPAENEEIKRVESCRRFFEDKFNFGYNPNVLFVAQVYIGDKCDLIWRVHEPEEVAEILKEEVKNKTYHFEFAYDMYHDIDWQDVGGLIDL